jgi:hypothetical protein
MIGTMEVGFAIMMIVSLLGSFIFIGLIILFCVVSAQKANKKKQQLPNGTDKSPFAIYLMDKYHTERAENDNDL